MRYYGSSLDPKPVRALVAAASDHTSQAFLKALAQVKRELKRIDKEQADDQAEDAKREARLHPALTTQKVISILRRSRLTISHYESRGGTTEGLRVAYGDFERTFVKVSCTFTWNFELNHNLRKGDGPNSMRKIVQSDLFSNAQGALINASLKVTPIDDQNPHLSRLEVRS